MDHRARGEEEISRRLSKLNAGVVVAPIEVVDL